MPRPRRKRGEGIDLPPETEEDPPSRQRAPRGMDPDANREQLAAWMREQIDRIEKEHAERIELLRTVGEHPSPVFQRMVKTWSGVGMEKKQMALLLGIGVGTLIEHYNNEIELGKAEITALVATSMLKIATDPNNPQSGKVGMGILERRGGEEWKAVKKIEFEDKTKNAPIIDSSKLTVEEREQLRRMIERATGTEPALIEGPEEGESDEDPPTEEDPTP